MSFMKLPAKHKHGCILDGESLQIYIDEVAKAGLIPLHTWIMQEAHKRHLSGVYIFRANAGFGINGIIQTTSIVDLSCNLPVLVVVIDTRERISEFRTFIATKVKQGIIVSTRMTFQVQDQNQM